MNKDRQSLKQIPERYCREFEYQKERKINFRMTRELHKDMKRILVEQDESWQSVLEELLILYVLTHQDQVPSEVRELNLSQMPVDTDKELKAFIKKRFEIFNDHRREREYLNH